MRYNFSKFISWSYGLSGSLFTRREKVTDQLPGRNNGTRIWIKTSHPRLKCMQIAYPRCIHTRARPPGTRSIYVFKSPCSSSGTFVGFSNRTVYSCISICTYRSASHMRYAEIRPRALRTHTQVYRLSSYLASVFPLSNYVLPSRSLDARLKLQIAKAIRNFGSLFEYS